MKRKVVNEMNNSIEESDQIEQSLNPTQSLNEFQETEIKLSNLITSGVNNISNEEIIPQVIYKISNLNLPTIDAKILHIYQYKKDLFYYSLLFLSFLTYLILTITIYFFNHFQFLKIIFSVIFFIFLFILSILPKRIEIWSNSLKIRFLCGLSFSTLIEDIENVDLIDQLNDDNIKNNYYYRLNTFFQSKFVKIERKSFWLEKIYFTPNNIENFVITLRSLLISSHSSSSPSSPFYSPQFVIYL